jgi:hypothetical protein
MNPRHTFARPARHPSHFARHRPLDAIEWEEMPSLAGRLRRNEFSTTHGSVWSSTERMELDRHQSQPAPAPAPFVETLSGLYVREIAGDEVFRHFFGDPGANH